jgi:hypothetical protein
MVQQNHKGGSLFMSVKTSSEGKEKKHLFEVSTFIKDVTVEPFRLHKADGDMWPITWAADGNLYAAAGDNQESPMNFWRVEGHPSEREWGPPPLVYLVDNMPLNPKIYCQRPNVHPKWGIKPASLLSMDGVLYFAVELMNFGDNPQWNRQRNVSSWIITSGDFGKSWNREATPADFFTGRLASPHFLQFGQDYGGARDRYVYAYFPAGDDGGSYWENADMRCFWGALYVKIFLTEVLGNFSVAGKIAGFMKKAAQFRYFPIL